MSYNLKKLKKMDNSVEAYAVCQCTYALCGSCSCTAPCYQASDFQAQFEYMTSKTSASRTQGGGISVQNGRA